MNFCRNRKQCKPATCAVKLSISALLAMHWSALPIFALFGLLIETASILPAQTPNQSKPSCPLKDGHQLVLTVLLNDPWNQNHALRVPLEIRKPFRMVDVNGKVRNTISGLLGACSKGTYPLKIQISEWVSPENNVSDAAPIAYRLQVDKPFGPGGVIASNSIWARTLTLSETSNSGR
jgi:hypothetical protein